VLQRRNRIRNTEGEDIPAGYLSRIGELYDRYIGNIDEIYNEYGLNPPRVLTIDASVDFLQDESYLTSMLDEITGSMGE